MDLTNLNTIKSLLHQYNIRPKRYMAQHFLIDREVLEEIIATAEISSKDLILEIGPGLGTLTLELAKYAQKIIAVEKDSNLYCLLKEILKIKKINNVITINQDILKISNCQFLISKQTQNTKYKVVANLPYYLTARVIRKFLEMDNPPEEMTLTIQKEVAQRICAQPPKMNLLAVSVQFYAQPEITAFISKKSFWPQPEVDSAIIKISKIKKQKSKIFKEKFFKIVRAGFSSPRKKLVNNLLNILNEKTRSEIENDLQRIGLSSNCRAQNLSVDNWRKLTSLLKKNEV